MLILYWHYRQKSVFLTSTLALEHLSSEWYQQLIFLRPCKTIEMSLSQWVGRSDKWDSFQNFKNECFCENKRSLTCFQLKTSTFSVKLIVNFKNRWWFYLYFFPTFSFSFSTSTEPGSFPVSPIHLKVIFLEIGIRFQDSTAFCTYIMKQVLTKWSNQTVSSRKIFNAKILNLQYHQWVPCQIVEEEKILHYNLKENI